MHMASLTARELDVLQRLAQGCTYRQVAHQLHVSAHTVQTHIKNIYSKLEVHSARAAIWRAVELKLLSIIPS
jgi:ATP/maltotriose-dependent transcriptional regulator MalT